jgi:hypothetical protein
MARPAAREPGPLVTSVRYRTVAKVNDRAGRAQVHPVLGREVVKASSWSRSSVIFAAALGNFAR